MSTMFRTKISPRNNYYIPSERLLELQHFCRQFPGWVEDYNQFDIRSVKLDQDYISYNSISDITAEAGIKKAKLSKKIKMVNVCAYKAVKMTCPWLNDTQPLVDYLIGYVTIDQKGDMQNMHMALDIISEDRFYILRRCFFWLLDQTRD